MKRLFVLVLLSLFGLRLFAQNEDLRGLKIVVRQLEGETAVAGRQYAVLIAVDKYQTWMALRNPVEDAKAIKDILVRKYFITDFIELYNQDATKAGIIKLFNKLINDIKPEDSVLIFYAGHGYLDKSSNTGFWIPVDGGTDIYQQANWLPNAQIRGFISNMLARHVALIADSCFSGDILNPTRGLAPTITSEYFKNAYARISRQVLTSGASESVPDESQFTRQLKLALEGNTSPYLDPLMLYNQIRLGVTQTTPLFGDLKDSGHQEGSSFLLFLKSPSDQAAPTEGAASSALGPKATFSLEKVSGKVNIETKTPGTLLLDGAVQGQVPAGRMATIANLEAGSHELEMHYDNGKTEMIRVTIDSDEPLSIRFGDVYPQAAALSGAGAGSQAGLSEPPKTPPKDSLVDGDSLPEASIRIDGTFDDWDGVLPAFTAGTRSPTTKQLAIEKVYCAVDGKNFYVRFDIQDVTPSSFFHSHNFYMDKKSSYGIDFENGMNHVVAEINFDNSPKVNRWNVDIIRLVDGRWEVIDKTRGNYAMRGSSLEASFPLEPIKKNLGDLGASGFFQVGARTEYFDDQWNLIQDGGDHTTVKKVAF